MSSTAPLTATELEALPVYSPVQCTTDRGRVYLALKIDQGTGRHNLSRFTTTNGPATTTQIACDNPRLLAAHPAPAPVSDTRREDVAREMGYRLRTVAAHYRMCGKHGEEPDPAFIEREIRGGTDVVLAALPAPPVVDETHPARPPGEEHLEAACAWADYRKEYGIGNDPLDAAHQAFMAGRESALGTLDMGGAQQ